MKNQSLLILIFILGEWLATAPLTAQGLEAFNPTASSDTTQATSDSLRTENKSKMHPLQVNQSTFFETNLLNSRTRSSFYFPNIPTLTKNQKDTIVYPSTFSDTQNALVNQYRSLNHNSALQQFNLGEPGSPNYEGFHPKTTGRLVDIGLRPFGSQITSANEMRFFRAFAPFTHFNYLQGPGKTIALNALHTQNFSPKWNVTMDYRSIINQEQYTGSEQNNALRNIKMGSLYLSPNNRYKQIIAFTWNRSNRNENGGLANESQFFIPQKTNEFKLRNLGFYDPKITTASSRYRQFEHLFAHKYQLTNHWSVAQHVTAQRSIYEFKDTKRDTTYYGRNYFNTISKTTDSNVWRTITHQTKIEYELPTKSNPIVIGIQQAIQSQTYFSNQINFNGKFNTYQNSQFLGFYMRSEQRFIPQINADFIYAGFGKSGKTIQATLPILDYNAQKINPARKNSLHICLTGSQLWQPISLFQSAFYSNHFQYKSANLFTGENKYGAQLQFNRLGKTNAPANTNSVNHTHSKTNTTTNTNTNINTNTNTNITESKIVTEDETKKYESPVQPRFSLLASVQNGQWLNPTLSIDSLAVTQLPNASFTAVQTQFSITRKHFQIFQLIQYNKYKSSQLNTLFNYGTPVWKTTTKLQIVTPAFHRAMLLTLGTDIQYTSKFQTTRYRADAAAFIVDSRNTQAGNYFELDLYILARVQSVDVFLKAEHINELFIIPGFNPTYQYISGYPIQPYRIRFGLNWKFYN